jgi:hypothetical protein
VLPSLEEIPDEDLDLSMDILEKYWGNDERWLALGAAAREEAFSARFGEALARGAAKRKVRSTAHHGLSLDCCLLRCIPLVSNACWDHVHDPFPSPTPTPHPQTHLNQPYVGPQTSVGLLWSPILPSP